MNQGELSQRVVARLTSEAERDRYRWVAAVGWIREDGTPYGLALELIGPAPTDAQLSTLARVLFRLFTEGVVEIAGFHRPAAGAARLGEPLGDFSRTGYELSGAGGSMPLSTRGPREYGVRLAAPARGSRGAA